MQTAKPLTNLQALLNLLDSSLALDEMLPQVICQLVQTFAVDHGCILLFGTEAFENGLLAQHPPQEQPALKLLLSDYRLRNRLKIEQKPIPLFDSQPDPITDSTKTGLQTLGLKSSLIIPLLVRDKLVGGISLDSIEQPRSFTAQEIALSQVIGKQLGVVIDYSYALEATRASRRQAQILRRVNRVLNESLELDEILLLILEQLEKVVTVDGSTIYLLSGAEIHLKAWRGQPHPSIKKPRKILIDDLWGAAEIVAQKQTLLVSNTAQHPGWTASPNSPVKSWLGVPLIVRGEVVGIMTMEGYKPHQFSQEAVPLVRAFARQSALAIHNARLFQAERSARIQADTLRQVAAVLNETLDLQQVLERILAQLRRVVTCDSAAIILREADNFRIVAGYGFPEPEKVVGMTFAFAQQRHFQEIARTHRPLVIADTRTYKNWQWDGPTVICSWIGAPLLVAGKLIGLLTIYHSQPNFYTEANSSLITGFADLAAIALENARLYEFEVKQVEQELHIARQIQQGFLPDQIPQIAGWEIAAICLPARETGGDFYDFIKRRDGSVGLIIGDVSGKGISAAMLMGAAQSVVVSKGSDHRAPANVMTETNRLLYEDVPAGNFVALSYALVSPNQGQLRLSNGGQLAPYWLPAGNSPVQLIETPGPHLPVGIVPEISYRECSQTLAPGDVLVFYTDGLVECKNQQGDMFGFERVANLLDQLRGQSPQAILQALLQASRHFVNNATPHDDITLLVIRRQNI